MEKKTPLKTRAEEYDYIDDETSEYVKYKVQEKQIISFYLGPFGRHFIPCEEDQERLNYILEHADPLKVLYSNATIKLQRRFEPVSDTEEEIERRTPTKEDFKKCFSIHWFDAWKEYLKEAEKN